MARWHTSQKLFLIITNANRLHIVDIYFNDYIINDGNNKKPYLQVQNDPLFPKISQVFCSEFNTIGLVSNKNIAIVEILTSLYTECTITLPFLVNMQLQSGNIDNAFEMLRQVEKEDEFTQGFIEICNYLHQNI